MSTYLSQATRTSLRWAPAPCQHLGSVGDALQVGFPVLLKSHSVQRTRMLVEAKDVGLVAQAYKLEDRFLINPGSATGAYGSMAESARPSFVLMDMDAGKV